MTEIINNLSFLSVDIKIVFSIYYRMFCFQGQSDLSPNTIYLQKVLLLGFIKS